eukprot:IDg19519t1
MPQISLGKTVNWWCCNGKRLDLVERICSRLLRSREGAFQTTLKL